MIERLETCDTWHPDAPSRLSEHRHGFRNGKQKLRIACLECQRIQAAESRCRGPYGVLPRLDWPAPEFMT